MNLLNSVLTPEQLEHFYKNGYLIIPNAVDVNLVSKALQLINYELRDPKALEGGSSGTYCKSITSHPTITNLFNQSPALPYVAQLLGEHATKQMFGGQIALRFPGTLCQITEEGFSPIPWWKSMWHIDGFHSKENGIPKGAIRNFSILCGVILNDLPSEFCGNLVLYPRSHHLLENFFQKNGFEGMASEGVSSLPQLPLSTPLQVTGPAGTLVLAHYQLAHSIAPNTSPHIRYAVYFRANARSENVHHPEPMLNIWLDFPGLSSTIQKFSGERESLIREYQRSAIQGSSGYVDERIQSSLPELYKKDLQRMELVKKADEAFEKHQWDQAAQLYEKALELNSVQEDFFVVLKCCASHTFGSENNLLKGEQYLLQAIKKFPTIPNVYVLLGQNLARQKKLNLSTIEDLATKALNCGLTEETPDYIVDVLKLLRDVLLQTNHPSVKNHLQPFLQKARQKYPLLEPRLSKLDDVKELEISALWEQGQKWIHSPQKDMIQGQQLFSKLAALDPPASIGYWANLLAGGAFSWGGKPVEGESYIRAALKIDPLLPHAYAGLAQNLLAQGKHQPALDVVKESLGKGFVLENTDHEDKIIELLSVAKKAGSQDLFKSYCITVLQKYPNLKKRVEDLSNQNDCLIQ